MDGTGVAGSTLRHGGEEATVIDFPVPHAGQPAGESGATRRDRPAAEPAFGPQCADGALQERFREAMAAVATPVSVVTAFAGTLPHGTTVSAFASLSMKPPMVLVSLDRGSQLLGIVRRSGRFGVNVLSSDQSAFAMAFAKKGGPDKFTGVPWEPDHDLPRLVGAAGWLVCEVTDLVTAGDHVVALATVQVAENVDAPPLTYHRRLFGTHTGLEAQA
ncbi:MAG: putative oxidoreductase [Frankiales bacterium]|nr:putative oxidoreductase [Frankiales bacterium]